MFVWPRLTTVLVLVLAAVLVMTQTLGVVHTITHGSSGSLLHSLDDDHAHAHAHAHDHDHDHDHDQTAAHSPGASNFLASLFSSHEDASACRLYDHASQDGGQLAAISLTLPVIVPPSKVAIFQGQALARWAALFDARGPPVSV